MFNPDYDPQQTLNRLLMRIRSLPAKNKSTINRDTT